MKMAEMPRVHLESYRMFRSGGAVPAGADVLPTLDGSLIVYVGQTWWCCGCCTGVRFTMDHMPIGSDTDTVRAAKRPNRVAANQ